MLDLRELAKAVSNGPKRPIYSKWFKIPKEYRDLLMQFPNQHQVDNRIKTAKQNIEIMEMDGKLHPFTHSKNFTTGELVEAKAILNKLIRYNEVRRAIISYFQIEEADQQQNQLITALTNELISIGLTKK